MPKLVLTREDRRLLKALEQRRARNAKRERVDNATLFAGSDMYYYCRACGQEMTLPEAHTCPVPTLCRACRVLEAKGILPERKHK